MPLENFSDIVNVAPQKNYGGSKMQSLVADWLSYIKHRYCRNTFVTYRMAMNEFLKILPPQAPPEIIKPAHIEKLLSQTIDRGCSPSTANLYLAAVKSFYRWAGNYHDIKNVAAPVINLNAPQPKIRVLTDGEYTAIIQVLKGLDRDAIQFLANTGLRRNEFKSLRWQDFNNDFVHVVGKGYKDRFVPLNKICKNIIGTKHISYAPPFVIALKGYQPIYKLCARASEKANINYFTPHSLRHFFATRLIRIGVPLIKVSKLLGHASTQITEQVYIHFIPADLRVTDVLEF
jgi:integrase